MHIWGLADHEVNLHRQTSLIWHLICTSWWHAAVHGIEYFWLELAGGQWWLLQAQCTSCLQLNQTGWQTFHCETNVCGNSFIDNSLFDKIVCSLFETKVQTYCNQHLIIKLKDGKKYRENNLLVISINWYTESWGARTCTKFWVCPVV